MVSSQSNRLRRPKREIDTADKRRDNSVEELKADVLKHIECICSNGMEGLKATSNITRVIELTENKTFTERYRSVPHNKRPEFKKLLDELYANGIIVDSKSDYCSPPNVVLKSDGSIRFTVDYKKLNSMTVKDNYPLPIMDELFKDLSDAEYLSKMDLESGYYQIAMDAKSRKFTAFLCEYGLFEWTRMPMGHKNSAATFQRAMNHIFRDQIGRFLHIYMDDFIVYSRTPEQHLEHLKTVINKLHKAQMRVKLRKCSFFQREIEFLGHLIRKGTIKPFTIESRSIVPLRGFKNVKTTTQFSRISIVYKIHRTLYRTSARTI